MFQRLLVYIIPNKTAPRCSPHVQTTAAVSWKNIRTPHLVKQRTTLRCKNGATSGTVSLMWAQRGSDRQPASNSYLSKRGRWKEAARQQKHWLYIPSHAGICMPSAANAHCADDNDRVNVCHCMWMNTINATHPRWLESTNWTNERTLVGRLVSNQRAWFPRWRRRPTDESKGCLPRMASRSMQNYLSILILVVIQHAEKVHYRHNGTCKLIQPIIIIIMEHLPQSFISNEVIISAINTFIWMRDEFFATNCHGHK